jgi:hypothetical protein
MKTMSIFIMFFILFLSIVSYALAGEATHISETSSPQQSVKTSSGQSANQHSQHHAEVNRRGDKAMGFSHEKTAHHFRLFKDGGAIEVNAREAKDADSIAQIRMHLAHIAQMFSDGNFSTPMLVHDELPPGAELMAKLKNEIAFKYEETKVGGRVRISTSHKQALSAIYDFLRYQIKEHQTGDSLEINK